MIIIDSHFGQLDFMTSRNEYSNDGMIFNTMKCFHFDFEVVKFYVRLIDNFNQFTLILKEHLLEEQIEELKQLRELVSI